MDTISQTTFSNVFSSMKMFEFWLRFHWSLFLRVKLTIFQHCFSHYLNQWWLGYWSIYAPCGLNELCKPYELGVWMTQTESLILLCMLCFIYIGLNCGSIFWQKIVRRYWQGPLSCTSRRVQVRPLCWMWQTPMGTQWHWITLATQHQHLWPWQTPTRTCMPSHGPLQMPVWWQCRKYIRNIIHDDVIKWKHFPRYWPFVRGIHRPPVNSPHKDQLHGALMFSLICAWIE